MPQNADGRDRLTIDLVYEPSCPNVDSARVAIRGALSAVGAPPAWREWDSTDPATPERLRLLGSPTVLVNGRDVAGDGTSPQVDANSCRIYADDTGCMRGAPSLQMVVEAIQLAASEEQVLNSER